MRNKFYKSCPIIKDNELSLLSFVLAVILEKRQIGFGTWFNEETKLDIGVRHIF